MTNSTQQVSRKDARRRAAWRRRLVSFLLAPALLITGILGAVALPQAAQAAGNAQVLVNVVAVDPSTGNPITTLAPGQKIGFRVDFSCVAADCTNATVKFDPTQLDPNHQFYRLLVKSGFTPPLSGTPGPVTGSDAAGWTVPLGNLVAGQSGQFTLEFSDSQQGRGVGWVNYGPERMDYPVANFPDGFPITQTVRGNADTASGEQAATSAPVLWRINAPNPSVVDGNLVDPQGRQVGPGGVLATDTNYTFGVGMASGCVSAALQGNYYGVWGQDVLCASGFTVTQQLPPGAELVAAEGSPAVSGSVATGLVLTWTGPDWTTSGTTSQMGWGTSYWGQYYSAHMHSVTIAFPRANLAPAGQTCEYDAQTSVPSVSSSLTYISMPGTPGIVKNVSWAPGGNYTVRCSDPFPRAEMDPKTAARDGGHDLPGGIAPVLVPATGTNQKSWGVTVANTANIDGIATVTDNSLDQPDLPVYQIVAPAGSTIAWTATDGTTTQSGTSTGTANAPTGFRFATSTVTSPTLPAPNHLKTETNRAAFTVTYNYKVSPGAPDGAQRTNTASAVMTWPGHPEFADTPLGPTSKTVQLVGPFTRLNVVKYAAADSGQNFTIPATGTRNFWWMVEVRNSGNTAAIPTVKDLTLDDPQMPITTINAQVLLGNGNWTWQGISGKATLDDGTTATFTNVGNYVAPAGRHIVSATVSGSTPLPGWSTVTSDTGYDPVQFYFSGPVSADAIPGYTKTNTATGSLDTQGVVTNAPPVTASATATLIGASPVMTASLGTPAIAQGATRATTTSDVTFPVCGSTSNVAASRTPFTPEYVFMAPEGWNITAGSASFPAGSVPNGVTFQYRTVTVSGVLRQVAIATWPEGTSFGQNKSLPCMSVIARPSASVAAGSAGVPRGFITNSGTVLAGDQFTNEFTDTPDIDGNPATMRFSEAPAIAGVPVAAVAAMQVLKEICLPDASKPDGCQWFADPNNRVGVPPNSTSIKYRISITNTGNTSLSNVVGYDVLPYPGDTGTSQPTAGAARGSTFTENVASVSDFVGMPQVTYSASTQPCRAEVDPTVANCTNDWQSSPAGAQSIRMAYPGTFAPGQVVSMEYDAAVLNSPGDGAVGCNSLAVRATGLANVSEPAPVCASIEETDLAVTAGTPHLQIDRPGVLPWTVVNNGGAASSQAVVTVTIPQGLSAFPLKFTGWTCTAADSSGNPQYGTAVGPSTLSCTPESPLLKGVPQQLNVPVVPTVASFTSTAHITGRLYDGNLTNNDATMNAVAAPAASGLDISKDDGVTTAKPGDQLTYTIPVHNTLLYETITGATLTDPLPGGVQFVSASDGGAYDASTGIVTWAMPDIPGNGTVSRTVTVQVLSTIAAKTIKNTATVSAPDPAFPDATLTGSASDTDTVKTSPAISLTKNSSTQTYSAVGNTITYTFTAKNTGDVTLQNVSVADPLPGLGTITYGTWPSGAAGTLAPGQSVTATATYSITQADLDATTVVNTATVNGSAPDGTGVTAKDTHTITSTAAPSILLDKQTSSVVSKAGDVVTYSFTVTNNGPLTLQNVSIADPLPGLSKISFGVWPGTVGTLAPGQSVTATATYTATQKDVDKGSISNTATATGTTLGGVDATDKHSAVVNITPAPAITLTKGSTEATYAKAGDTVHYTFSAQNTGNVTLTSVTISDPHAGLSSITYTWPTATAGTLAPGQTVAATATYTITQADVDATTVTNTATVTGTPPTGADVTAEASRTIEGTAKQAISLDKQTSSIVKAAGDVVTYDFTVTNTSPLTLNDVTITDPLPGLSSITYGTWPGAVGVLKPGERVTATATYTATQADVNAGRIDNTATVTGTTKTGKTATDEHSATVNISEAPAISLTKGSLEDTFAKVGDVIDYTFSAQNTGNVTLHGVTIADPLPGLSSVTYTWPGTAGELAPGQTVTATATYAITQADLDATKVTNTATVTGTSPKGTDVFAKSSRTVDGTALPSIHLTKTSDSVVHNAGDPVTYSFTVTNTSNLTLQHVAITDPLPGLSAITYGTWPGTVGELAPGQSVTATATYSATQADVDAGKIDNEAAVIGTTKSGVSTNDTAKWEVAIDRTPSIDLHKTGAYDPGHRGVAGDWIRYSFTTTNTGNTTLTNVVITDPLPGLTAITYTWPGDTGTLLPGQTATATASYKVTQKDVDGLEGVDNTATVTSDAPNGTHPRALASVHMPTPQKSGIQLVKSGTLDNTSRAPRAGDTVTYRFAATNLGDVTLTEDTIVDPMEGLSALSFTWPGTAGELAPGETVTATATYTLTQADIDASKVVNNAETSGIDPGKNIVKAGASFTLVLPADAKLTLKKTGAIAQGFWKPGMTVDYGFVATNTGNTTLKDVVITDPMPGLTTIAYTWPGTTGVLAPGEKVTATATYQLTANDVAKLKVTNTATATSDRAQKVTDSVTLAGPIPPPMVSVTPPGVPAYSGDPNLARTGGTVNMLPVALGMILLGIGMLAVIFGRRRRRSEQD